MNPKINYYTSYSMNFDKSALPEKTFKPVKKTCKTSACKFKKK